MKGNGYEEKVVNMGKKSLYKKFSRIRKGVAMFDKVKQFWNERLSDDSRSRTKQMWWMPLLGYVAATSLTASATAVSPVIIPAFVVVATLMGAAMYVPHVLTDVFYNSRKNTTWKNDIGQTLESTKLVRNDLESAQSSIDYAVQNEPEEKRSAKLQSIMDRFADAAKRVRIVEDIPESDNRFRFALKTKTAAVKEDTQHS